MVCQVFGKALHGMTNTKLVFTNAKHEEVDFKEFGKIVADENAIH